MYLSRRQSEILAAVELAGSTAIAKLARDLGVSDETIRRNVKPLVAQGLVRRVHGGITALDPGHEAPFQSRMTENAEAKQAIAEAVVNLIADGDTLILDGGSTTAFVARALRRRSELVAVTNSAEIARTLATKTQNRVFMAGGELRADDAASLGATAISYIRQFRVRHAILSLAAIGNDGSLMVYEPAEAEYSRTVIDRAENVIVAVDHSKFSRQGMVRICDLHPIDVLVTDAKPPDEIGQHLADANVQVVVAGGRHQTVVSLERQGSGMDWG